MSKEFVEIKRRLGSQYPFDMFKLENPDYLLNIYYQGDYEKDKANHSLDPQKFTIDCKVKPKSICLDLMINKTEGIFIRTDSMDFLEGDDVEAVIESLKRTKENLERIRGVIEEYTSN